MTYDFKEQLRKSEAPELEERWQTAYRAFFPEHRGLVKMTDSMFVQQFGFDRIVVDDTGRSWKVEEKIDFYDNDRIALEYVSNTKTGKAGWVVKPSQADFILYRKEKQDLAWLWSAPMVRRTWAIHGKAMIKMAKERVHGFVHGEAANKGYSSLCVCAPITMWERALRASTEVEFLKDCAV